MKTINKVSIYAPQDPSVGLPSIHIEIDLMGYETDDLESLREILANCFGQLYDDTVYVDFDFELN
jgi:hypothetical protein